jgi:hypothetical protein
MECKQNFNGFQEGDINFPPTYKFDVLKTLKVAKSKRRYSMKEVVKEILNDGHHEDEGDDSQFDQRSKPFYGVEAGSMVSSIWTGHSKGGTATVTEGEEEDDEGEGEAEAEIGGEGGDIQPSASGYGLGIPGLRQFIPGVWKIKSRRFADLAKVRSASNTAMRSFKSSPSLSPSPSSLSFPQVLPPTPGSQPTFQDVKVPLGMPKRLSVSTSDLHVTPSNNGKEESTKTSKQPWNVHRSNTGRDVLASDTSMVGDGGENTRKDDTAIYDSSSKQRVPSW